MFDLKIVNGLIFAGASAGQPWPGCVAVKDGRIAALGAAISGSARHVLDAAGQAVSPGFIDLHTHCSIGHNLNYLQAGVTTVVSGNCGFGRLPAELPECVAGRCGPNIAFLTGHNSARREVVGNVNRAPTPGEMGRMVELVAADMAAGAMGLSAGLEYVPGYYAETSEVIRLARPAADAGGIYTVHMRNEGDRILDAIGETLRISEEAGLPAHVSHIKTVGVNNFGRSREVIAVLDAARRRGLDVTHDQYPYTACCGRILLLLSQRLQEGSPSDLRARLDDPAVRARARSELTEKLERVYGGDTSRVVVATAPDAAMVGRNLAEIAGMRGRSAKPDDVADAVLDVVKEYPDQTAIYCVFHNIAEEDVRCFMLSPFTAVGSDGWSVKFREGHAQPRHYGTCPRVLGRYSRDLGIFPLSEALRRMTALPAERLRLADRGVIAEGAWADLVVFDPDAIRDTATFDEPHQYPVGISWVIVNGQIAVDHSRPTGLLPGVFVPRPATPARKTTCTV
ncbi:MAG: amidohydrolase family protein [Lentisphaerae bacterium]|nr:amidohydrolase family protein [Lentisphaerota bacterium]